MNKSLWVLEAKEKGGNWYISTVFLNRREAREKRNYKEDSCSLYGERFRVRQYQPISYTFQAREE
jgi:hypothetical protein